MSQSFLTTVHSLLTFVDLNLTENRAGTTLIERPRLRISISEYEQRYESDGG